MDLTASIAPRSDQINAEDLLTGPRTFTVQDVTPGTTEQPVNVNLVELPGRPYKPSKTMRRVLVSAWGKDSTAYAGRRLTLFRDPEVTFGREKVGGIKISHLSHIDTTLKLRLTATRGKRVAVVVEPLVESAPTPVLDDRLIEDATTVDELRALWQQASPQQQARIQERVGALQSGVRDES